MQHERYGLADHASTRQPIAGVAGVILAGGQSRRMGRPKAQLPFGDTPLLGRVARLLGEVCEPIVVVAREPQAYPDFGLSVVVDHFPAQGPPSGLHAGLTAVPTEYAVVVACDLPFLNPALLRHLIELRAGWDVVAPWADGFPQPLHAVYHRRVAPHAPRSSNGAAPRSGSCSPVRTCACGGSRRPSCAPSTPASTAS